MKESNCFPDKQGVIKHISYRYDYGPIRRSTHPYTVYELWVDGILKCKRTCGQIQKGSNTMPLVHNINQFKKLCRLFASKFTVEKSKVRLEFQVQK